MITITNLNIAGLKLTDEVKLAEILTKALVVQGIKFKITTAKDGSIIFHEVEKGKMFISEQENMVPMKDTDPRIAKLGRKHLGTNRLTKEQYNSMVEILTTTFTRMGVGCQIEFQESGDDTTKYTLVDDKTIVGALPIPGNFPLKKGA